MMRWHMFWLLLLLPGFLLSQDHLLITEFAVTPTAGEFVEIYNPTSQMIDLSNYYLTDATFAGGNTYYYNIVTGSNAGGGGFGDFHARFPDGATIAPGEVQTIAMNGSDFVATYGVQPTYELWNTTGAIPDMREAFPGAINNQGGLTNSGEVIILYYWDGQSDLVQDIDFVATYGVQPTYELWNTTGAIPDMREAFPGSINNQGGLTNSGEVIILYYWDGQSDLVQDIDYVVWGDKAEAVDKTGVSIDGPDPDNTPSTYLPDTPISQQISVSPDAPHSGGESRQRQSIEETGEILSGGNGLAGHDETSENLAASFQIDTPTPGTVPFSFGTGPSITNVSHTPASPIATDTVTVTARVTDDGQVVAVRLHVSVNGAPPDSADMLPVGGDQYQGLILPQPEGATVQYFITAEDDQGNITTSATFSYVVATITPIADIQANPGAFTTVTIQGIVTLGAGITITSRTEAYVQDGSGRGINLFSFDPPNQPPNDLLVRGNEVRITGTVEEFVPTGGTVPVTEITNYTVQLISTGNPIPEPLELTTAQANNTDLEGTYIKVVGVITDMFTAGEGVNIDVDDGTGPVLVRVWNTTGIDLSGLSVGDSLEVHAVMDIFDDAAQLVPGYPDELTFPGSLPGDGTGTATVDPDSVGILQTLTDPLNITVTGTAEYVLERVSVTVPEDWEWSGLITSVQLEGSGFSGATFEIRGREIVVRNAAVTDVASGTVHISDLTTPVLGTFSTFTVKTAVAGGKLLPIAGSPVVKVGEGVPTGIIPIALIQEHSSAFEGKQVTVQGVVTLGAGIITTARTEAYLQDSSGRGINLFSFDPPNQPPNNLLIRGNEVRITGTVTEFNGVTEITDYSVQFIAANQPLPEPLFVSTALANDLSFEGTYMKVLGVVEAIDKDQDDNDLTLTLRDDLGTVAVRVWEATGINLSFLRVGDSLAVLGVMDVFNNQSQIVPGYRDEIIVPGRTSRADGTGLVVNAPTVVLPDSTYDSLSIALSNFINEPITTVRMDVPKLWGWSGNPVDVRLGGEGIDNASVSVSLDPIDSVYQVSIRDVAITQADTAVITIRNLTTPAEDSLFSVFWIYTAGAGGRLQLMAGPPEVRVGVGGRYLIYDLQTNSAEFGGTITVRGVTTIGWGLLRQVVSSGDSVTTAYIQDESGRGINLFRFGVDRELARGNLVEVSGQVVEFNGVTEMEYTSLTLLAENMPLPAPVPLSNAEVNDLRWDGTLISTQGVILEKFSAGGGTTLVLGDGKGTTNVRIWDTAGLDLSEFNVNDRILVEGVGSLFLSNGDSVFQILTTYQDQIRLDPTYAPSLADVDLRVEPHPFAPDQGEKIEITYNAGVVNNRITIRIFDLGGRLITTLVNENAQLIENTIEWDGRDRLNELVPLGTYICHLEVVEPVSGKRRVKMAPIVVGTVLSR